MGRPLRFLASMTTYHCFSRTINNEKFLEDEQSKELFLQVLDECQEHYSFQLIAYQVMDDHFHLIIKTLENLKHSISVIIKWIKMTFTKRYNKDKKRRGPLWSERFGAKVVDHARDAKRYLNYLLWYLEYNPIRRGLTTRPGESLFGSIKHYLLDGSAEKSKLSGPKVTVHEHFLSLAENVKERIGKFLKYEQKLKNKYSAFSKNKSSNNKSFLQNLHRRFVTIEKEKAVQKELSEKQNNIKLLQ